jgi:hypothetical protein
MHDQTFRRGGSSNLVLKIIVSLLKKEVIGSGYSTERSGFSFKVATQEA